MFLLAYWKHLVIAIAISLSLYTLYNKIYYIGYAKAAEKYEQVIAKYELDLNKRIAEVEYNSRVLIDTLSTSNKKFSEDTKIILKSVKDKPLYVVTNSGKCTASQDFVNSYNSVIQKANKHE